MCRTHASSFYKNFFKYTLYISVLYSNLHVSPRKNKIGYVYIMSKWGTFMQPLFPWKSNKYCIFAVCVYSLRYPVCNAHALYCYLWPVRFYNTFPHYLTKGTIFEKKKLLDTKCVFWFPLQILLVAIVILRSNERDKIKNIWRSSWKASDILVRF